MGHIRGQSRDQATLFAETLDDLLPASHPVRVVDAFVNSLDLEALGFRQVRPASTGRPPYHPGDLLKLYVYGYLNQIRSSRRLEQESHRNIEVLWLLNRLCPDFKTIADFRRDNRAAMVGVCRTFTQFCRGEGLFGAQLVAIDGSKFRAVGSRRSTVTPAGIEREVAQIDAHIEAYLASLDEVDSDDPGEPPAGGGDTASALSALQSRRAELQALAQSMKDRGVNQQVTTEPDARLMRHSGGSQAVSYNIQTAVDDKYKLIAAHAVTNEGNDHRQLYPMASAARSALGVETLTVVADVGYQNGEQGAACEAAGITAVVPRQKPVNPRGEFFDKSQFVYEATQDQYRCPAGEALRVYKTDHQLKVRFYRTSACEQCHLRVQCTTAKRRSINRHFYAAQVEVMNQRAVAQPALMRLRACLSEHPFGTMKRMTETGQFLMRGLANVRAEMALSVLSYNLLRAINILGVQRLCAQLAQ